MRNPDDIKKEALTIEKGTTNTQALLHLGRLILEVGLGIHRELQDLNTSMRCLQLKK